MREREHNEHCLFFQLSDRPLGLMETRHPYGVRLRRLGSRLGFVASLGHRRANNNLSGSRRLKTQALQMQTSQERPKSPPAAEGVSFAD
jgi:hypothetical protein